MTSATLSKRPPIVVVMGHVDHGKSTLLDYIRNTNVVAGEAGGITQHMAAYEVEHEHEGTKQRITFIDTPGHAAFKTIRARGANVADIAILVVAADDGVKAQTLEALASIQASNTPFIVAINKIDKPNADVERAKYSLLEHGVYLEGLGGDIPWAPISAKQGTGVRELLDLVILATELTELTGDPSQDASGFVIEANRDPKRGVAATLIVTNGSMQTGMFVAAGSAVSPLRHMEDSRGKTMKEVSFSSPVRVFGFDSMPEAGSVFTSHHTRVDADAAAHRAAQKEAVFAASAPQEGSYVVPLVVKADTAGSLDAVFSELAPLNNAEVSFKVVSAGLGPVSEGDIKTALASPDADNRQAIVVGFTVEADKLAQELARNSGISIEHFDIIYKLTERLEAILKERKPIKTVREVLCRARILKVFSNKQDEYLLGGKVEEGLLTKNCRVQLMRKGEMVGRGQVLTMQVARQSVDKVQLSSEFGAQVHLTEDPLPGDILESFTESKQ